jgi:cytoplasmic tRNA 2-thiolation protein 1
MFRYAYFKKLDYFSTECIYSPDAYRGHARTFLKDLEAARPSAIIDIIHSGEAFEVADEVKMKTQRRVAIGFPPEASIDLVHLETCKRCGYMSSNELCKACALLEGLERGIAGMGVVSEIFTTLAAPTDWLAFFQKDRGRKDTEPISENLRTIPYFQMPASSNHNDPV